MYQEIQQRVLNEARRLPYKIDKVKELTDIAIAALGRDFFNNIRYKNDSITGKKIVSHPLLKLLVPKHDMELGVSELMEVGLYLKEFYLDSAITECLNNLKVDKQYESTLFQMAFAYRFRKLGFKVGLEPLTLRGKSDILLEDENRKYVVECYRINKTFFEIMGEFHFDLATVVFDKVPKNKKYEFTVKLNELLTNDGRRNLLKAYTQLILEYNKKRPEKLETNWRNNLIAVRDLGDEGNYGEKETEAITNAVGHPDSTIVQMSVESHSVFNAYNAPEDKKVRKSRILIWDKFRREGQKHPYEILRKRINGKLKQTKVEDKSVGRILLVFMPFVFLGANSKAYKKVIDDVMRTFESISAVILISKEAGNGRFEYRGIVLNASTDFGLPLNVLQKLNQIEKSNLFNMESN